MLHTARRLASGRLRLGRLAVPLWAMGLGAVSILVAAGQAVGPVLEGEVTGEQRVAVEQAITLDTNAPLGTNPGFGDQDDDLGEEDEPDDGATTRNDEGTAFTVAMELNVGRRAKVNLYLANHSGRNAAAVLELEIPAGVDVELADMDDTDEGGTNTEADGSGDASDEVSEAQLSGNSWLLTVGAEAGAKDQVEDGVTIIVEPKDDLQPGFYTIGGRLFQVAG